ncbi:MAG: class I SAM-dependent methyltransferase [Spirochaetaceae bacterium]|jgi:SAM-dependent methyltransferase|nr:class I SAM-dependent methyltransferase [Spirochaetaceae bacterium]
MYKKEWFNEEYLWQQFAPIMFDAKHWEEIPAVADGITRFADLNLYGDPPLPPPGPRLLDLCCGFGRVALELARREFLVTGVDLTQAYLETGREDAEYENLAIEWIQADIRSFKRPAFFDVATNLYISFGYFERIEDDRLTAENVFASLKSGGTFIIETLGKELVARDFTVREWFPKAGFTVLTEYTLLDSWSTLHNRWILFKDGRQVTERTFTQRLYAASELRSLLLDVGFASVEIYGDWKGSPYDHQAEVLILVARKS